MKKLLLSTFILFAVSVGAVEIFDEYYVMSKLIPFVQQGKNYKFDGNEIKAFKINKKVLNSLELSGSTFYFYDSNGKKTKASIGDYLISPVTMSEIYLLDELSFKKKYEN